MPTPGTLWVIVGATGTGKSQLSLDLAAKIPGSEIVNADAMQLYRGMDIGTAKLPFSERQEIPHHLFDVLDVTEEATVAWYQPLTRNLIEERLGQGTDMILVGGSGLYVSSVIYDFAFPPRDEEIRATLNHELETDGLEALTARLHELDPAAAQKIDLKNGRRVVRALELIALGEPVVAELPEAPSLWWPDTRVIGIHSERAELVQRLERRVELMWDEGFVEEVQGLIPQGIADGRTASRAIGYAQILEWLANRMTREEAIEETQKLTRRYARRQVSWFKRYKDMQWIDGPHLELIEGCAR